MIKSSLRFISTEIQSLVVNRLPVKVANSLPLGAWTKASRWSIGIYSGKTLFDISEQLDIKNPVISRRHITDVRAKFVADPFMMRVNQSWYMFFEVLNQKTRRGEIGLAIRLGDFRQTNYPLSSTPLSQLAP